MTHMRGVSSSVAVAALAILVWAWVGGKEPELPRPPTSSLITSSLEPTGLLVDRSPGGGWLSDENASLPIRCDFDVVHWTNLTQEHFEEQYRGQRPVLIKGIVDFWPAKERGRWSYENLLKKLGSEPTKLSAGSTGAYLGGRGVRSATFGELMRGMRNATSPLGGEDFGFDRRFFKTHPTLYSDIFNPVYFSFITDAKLDKNQAWHVVSIGPSGAGFPFHAHGDAWLGLVYGAKRWTLYPPGRFAPPEKEKEAGYHPLMSSLLWEQKVLPRLSEGEKPLRCVQTAGDIMYVPAYWRHATINVGEAVAAGGQLALHYTHMPLETTKALLEEHPDDLELHIAAGVAFTQLAEEKANEAEAVMKEAMQQQQQQQPQNGMLANGAAAAAAMMQHMGGQLAAGGGGSGFGNYPGAQMQAEAVNLWREAAAHYEKAVALSPGNTSPYWTLVSIYGRMSDGQAARDTCVRLWNVLKRENVPPEVPNATLVGNFLRLAEVMVDDGYLFQDVADMLRKDVLPLDPGNVEALALLANAYGGMGLEADAATTLDRVLSVDSGNCRARWVLKRMKSGVAGGALPHASSSSSQQSQQQ